MPYCRSAFIQTLIQKVEVLEDMKPLKKLFSTKTLKFDYDEGTNAVQTLYGS